MCSGLRRHCLPVWQPLIRPFRLHTFAAWALSFAGRCLVFLIDLLYGKAVRALIPTAMIMLLMVYGAGSSSSILNGLSVAFVLHLDNHIPSTLLSGNDAVNIRATLNVHLADMKRVHLEGAAGDASAFSVGRRFEVLSASIAAMASFITAFHSASSWSSRITCEMQVSGDFPLAFVFCRDLPLAM
jgi:hypothetical protein